MISYYRSLYQDLKSGQHYLANLEITSNISYYLDDPKYYNRPENRDKLSYTNYSEKRFNELQYEDLVYIGNLSIFQRVYIGRTNNNFYVKTLTPYKDEYYFESLSPLGSEKLYITNKLALPVFPYSINAEGSYGVTYYTNTEGMNFTRNWNFYKHEGVLLRYLSFTKRSI